MLIIALCVFSCNEVDTRQRESVDSLNAQAYRIRYTDIDSTRALSRKALELADSYADGRARALNMLAYTDYQQMDFGSAFSKLDSIPALTNNQVILLVSDVLRMKINQRIGKGVDFFQSRTSAEKRMKRIREEYEHLQAVDLNDYSFARTEYHIISSTYYYYQEQERQAKEEIRAISDEFIQVKDTTQWLYYNYMLGSGGLIDGNYEEVALKEFDYLMICWGFSHSMGVSYFEGNSLQALAYRLSTPEDRELIKANYPDLFHLLMKQHEDWIFADSLDDAESKLPEALAQHALYAFRQYKDLFQMACAYRTLGELAFRSQKYEDALYYYEQALNCVNEQQQLYYPSTYTVPEWIAGIRQKISMAYSALGMKGESDYNRNIYLDILNSSSQNVEMESRKQQLQEETDALHLRFYISLALLLLLVILIVYFSYRLRKSNELKVKLRRQMQEECVASEADAARLEQLNDLVEELEENINLCRIKLSDNKKKNAEKRAKVALVHAVTPFLDRILNEINRINRSNKIEEQQIEYIQELTERIILYNEILTDWIKMEKGELSLHISTVRLDNIFQTLKRGHYAFDQKGIELDVQDTGYAVKADEALTLFMLNTLADNARKFTPEGGKVTIKAEDMGDAVELSVADTGCGMSEEDVETLNNSKVYDARKIGTSHDDHAEVRANKGFGFGIMNCRGIIEKYRKTSSIFQVCSFGVESRLGQGCRFYFRLPKVLGILLLFFSTFSLHATEQEAARLYELTYSSNLDEDYDQALQYASQALHALDPRLCLTEEEEASGSKYTNEVELFLKGDSVNYLLLLNIRNEASLACLALNDWDTYKYNNRIFTTLYKLYNQDQSLPTYCEQLEKTQSTSRQLQVLLVLFCVMLIGVLLMFFRRRMYLGKGLVLQQQMSDQLQQTDYDALPNDLGKVKELASQLLKITLAGFRNWQHVDGMRLVVTDQGENTVVDVQEGLADASAAMVTEHKLNDGLGTLYCYGDSYRPGNTLDELAINTLSHVLSVRIVQVSSMLTEIEDNEAVLKHLRYEEGRLHVQNQVLDNCLSTIKHESMYYPSRIMQLLQRSQLSQLTELATYYKEVYTLLCSSAEKQTKQISYRIESLQLDEYVVKAARKMEKMGRKKGLNTGYQLPEVPQVTVFADPVLLEELFEQFNLCFLSWQQGQEGQVLPLDINKDGDTLRVSYMLPFRHCCEEEAANLFYPESKHINLLIVKQIIRELDEMCNFPGLRLVAEPCEGGCRIWFTLKCK